jgi:hypothetical protein
LIQISNVQAMIASFPFIGRAAIPAVGLLAALRGGRRQPS